MILIDPMSLKGIDKLKKSLRKGTFDSAKATAKQLSDYVEKNIRTGYDDPVLGDGRTWQPLSPEREWTLRNAGLVPHPGLVAETEQLVGSLQTETIDDGTFRVNVGSTIDYAFAHEYGGGRGNVPARPFFNPAITHLKTQQDAKRIIRETLKEIET